MYLKSGPSLGGHIGLSGRQAQLLHKLSPKKKARLATFMLTLNKQTHNSDPACISIFAKDFRNQFGPRYKKLIDAFFQCADLTYQKGRTRAYIPKFELNPDLTSVLEAMVLSECRAPTMQQMAIGKWTSAYLYMSDIENLLERSNSSPQQKSHLRILKANSIPAGLGKIQFHEQLSEKSPGCREYTKERFGLQQMQKELRTRLFRDETTAYLDLEAAHPRIFAEVTGEPTIRSYVENRKEWHAAGMAHYGVDEATIKRLILALFNGADLMGSAVLGRKPGDKKAILRSATNQTPLPQFHSLQMAARGVYKLLVARFLDLEGLRIPLPTKVSRACERFERKQLDQVIAEAQLLGLRPAVSLFDGVMLQRPDFAAIGELDMERLSQKVSATVGMQVVVKRKSLDLVS